MEISLNALVEQVDDFLFEVESFRYREHAGLPTRASLSEIYGRFPELGRTEAVQRVNELLVSAKLDEQRKTGLTLLMRFLCEQVERTAAVERDEAVAAALRAPVATSDGEIPLEELFRRPETATDRAQRDGFERAAALACGERRGIFAHRLDAALASSSALGHPTYAAFRETVTGVAVGPLKTAISEVLSETADAYRDLLSYGLKRIDAQLLPQNARAHDLQRATELPWLYELFRREDLTHAVLRTLGDLNLDPAANGRLMLDTDDRPERRPGACVASLRTPDETRLVLSVGGGVAAYESWLSGFGAALQRAHVARTLPLLERRLFDAAIPLSVGRLFSGNLLEEGWLKRYLRLTSPQAKDASRLYAFRALTQLRSACAKAAFALEAVTRGPSKELDDEFSERMKAAVMVSTPPQFGLPTLAPLLGEVDVLRAFALEVRLHRTLQERFNEDFYRNPATGRWLTDLAATGGRERAGEVSKRLCGEQLSLAAAGRRLVAVLGR